VQHIVTFSLFSQIPLENPNAISTCRCSFATFKNHLSCECISDWRSQFQHPQQQQKVHASDVASWLLQCMVSQILLEENQMTSGHAHRDNSFATFKPQLSCEDISNCRSKFQHAANRLADANCALFMCGEW